MAKIRATSESQDPTQKAFMDLEVVKKD